MVKKKSKKAKEAYVYHILSEERYSLLFFREEQPEKITLPEPDLQGGDDETGPSKLPPPPAEQQEDDEDSDDSDESDSSEEEQGKWAP